MIELKSHGIIFNERRICAVSEKVYEKTITRDRKVFEVSVFFSGEDQFLLEFYDEQEYLAFMSDVKFKLKAVENEN